MSHHHSTCALVSEILESVFMDEQCDAHLQYIGNASICFCALVTTASSFTGVSVSPASRELLSKRQLEQTVCFQTESYSHAELYISAVLSSMMKQCTPVFCCQSFSLNLSNCPKKRTLLRSGLADTHVRTFGHSRKCRKWHWSMWKLREWM